MSKFERIVREPMVRGGQARIRDTGVTVNEIVRLSLDGSSQAEILRQFPQLEAEDVFQALGEAIAQESGLQVNTLQEIRNEIASIVGYSDIYLSGMRSEELSSEKIVEVIRLNAQRLRYKQMFYIQRARLLHPWYEVGSPVLIAIGALSKEIQTYIAEFAPKPFVKLDQEISGIKIDSNLMIIMGFLTQQRATQIIITKSEENILFRISLLEPFELRDEPVYSAINLASVIIKRNGSELKIRQEENTVIFEFALPIVEG